MSPKRVSGPDQAAADRAAAWEESFATHNPPPFVVKRLKDAAGGRAPWLATMTPAELLIATGYGVRPVAAVSGSCWFQYGRSWTEGHATGWRTALERIRAEAVACDANAVVDVRMRTVSGGLLSSSMDYTLIGTAVRIAGLPPAKEPVVATVPALEFVRLLQMGIVPCGLAVGAHYDWLVDYGKMAGGSWSWNNMPLTTLGGFWTSIRRQAHANLRADTARQGSGVLAHTHFSQLLKRERPSITQDTAMGRSRVTGQGYGQLFNQTFGPSYNQSGNTDADYYLGRHIVIGTAIERGRSDRFIDDTRTVVDMRDGVSPLDRKTAAKGFAGFNEHEGSI